MAYRVSQKRFPLLDNNNSEIFSPEIQLKYFWKAETCNYLAGQKYFKIEFSHQDGEQLNVRHEIKCKFRLFKIN